MKRDKIFLILIATLLLSLSVSILVMDRKEISVIENRPLTYFPAFSINSFIKTDFQNEMEDAFVDQIAFGEDIKARYNALKHKNLDFIVDKLMRLRRKPDTTSMPKRVSKDLSVPRNTEFYMRLIPRGEDLIEIVDTHHLILNKRKLSDTKRDFKIKADNYNKLVDSYPDIKFHSFYVETDADVDFVNGKITHNLVGILHKYLSPKINSSVLYVNHPLDYTENFYKTDHHWDTHGQILGYREIIKNLKGTDEKLLDIETVSIPNIRYNGYRSRRGNIYDIFDEFKLVTSDLREHKTYIDGVEGTYGKKEDYIRGEFSDEKGLNYYGDCNGADFGIVHFDFDNKREENILVFVDSFSNPIKEFIASHYNNTYFIDLRHYKETYGKDFDFKSFTKEHDVDHVLFTGYYTFYASDAFLINDGEDK